MEPHAASVSTSRRAVPRLRGAVLPLAMILACSAGCLPPAPRSFPPPGFPPAHAGRLSLAASAEIEAHLFLRELGDGSGPFLPFALVGSWLHDYAAAGEGQVAARLEILELASPLEALGLLAVLGRLPPGETIADARPVFSPGGARLFRKDRYLVRLLWPSGRRPDDGSLEALERAAAAALPGSAAPPPEAAALLAAGAREEDLSYRPGGAGGDPGSALLPAVLAALPPPPGGPGGTVFITVASSPESARGTYETFLLGRSADRKGVAFVLGIGESAATVWNGDSGWTDLSLQGDRLVGIAGLRDPAAGWPVVTRVLEYLRSGGR